MGDITKISWCDSSFNFWLGCTKASPGCQNCYAENIMVDTYRKIEWGPTARRVLTSEHNRTQPLRWNAQLFTECPACGWRGRYPNKSRRCVECNKEMLSRNPARRRVFAHSMSDVFEPRTDLLNWQNELFELWKATDRLDWLVLTKRPEHILYLTPDGGYPANVAMGVSVEDQEWSEKRIPKLLQVNSPVKFLSVEPMLGPVDLREWLPSLQWIICGSESGAKRRPFEIDWAMDLQEQCQRAHIPFFMKQGSAFAPGQQAGIPDDLWSYKQFPQFGGL